MATRLAAHRDGDDFTIALFEDNGYLNTSPATPWTDLLEGASTVSGEARQAQTYNPDGSVKKWSNWVTFTISLDVRRGRKSLYTNLKTVQDGEYELRFSIDGGPVLGPFDVRWP